MTTRHQRFLRFGIAAFLATLSLLVLIFPKLIPDTITHIFYLLLIATIILVLIPLEKLVSLKIGDVEMLLAQPQVRGAINAMGLSRIHNRRLRNALLGNQDDVEAIKNSRIIWIDDNPHLLVSLRRLFRSLGVQVTSVTSSHQALSVLSDDSDYDLIISDVQRNDLPERHQDAHKAHDGVNFIVYLRKTSKDSVLKNIPVIFYAAYPPDSLAEWTAPARNIFPGAEMVRSSVELVTKSIEMLAASRETPITIPAEKKGTLLKIDSYETD